LEAEDAVGDHRTGVEVGGGEGLPLEDGEVDLDLIEPAGVRGQMDDDEVAPLRLEPLDGPLPSMDGAAIEDPEDTGGGAVGLVLHDRRHEGVEGEDGDLVFDASEERGCPESS